MQHDVASPFHIRGMNGYAYVGNNPIMAGQEIPTRNYYGHSNAKFTYLLYLRAHPVSLKSGHQRIAIFFYLL